jgi:FkbM family methyltransferase
MNPLLGLLERTVAAFNQAACWQGECRVWNQTMAASTFERWLYLRLHQFGRMGTEERSNLAQIVRPGMTVLEVGGNIGLHTVLLSGLVGPGGRVISFEPDPDLFKLLQHNCRLNGCVNVAAHQLAAGRGPARLVLQKLIVNSGDNHLGDGGSRLFRRAVETQVVALDQFLPGVRPDLIKIDVQGWEFEVLQGLEGILRDNPDAVVYLELWPAGLHRAGCSVVTLVHWLHERGYRLYRATNPQPLNDDDLAVLTRQLTGLKHTDVIASRR